MSGGIVGIAILVFILTLIAMQKRKDKKRAIQKNQDNKMDDYGEAQSKAKETMAADKIVRFKTERARLEYDRVKGEALSEMLGGEEFVNEYLADEKRFEKQVERNIAGSELEKKGNIEKAIRLYEKNVEEKFEGSHPYERLSIIYRKRRQYDKEIRVLEKAAQVFGFGSKHEKIVQRLEKAKAIKAQESGSEMGEDHEV